MGHLVDFLHGLLYPGLHRVDIQPAAYCPDYLVDNGIRLGHFLADFIPQCKGELPRISRAYPAYIAGVHAVNGFGLPDRKHPDKIGHIPENGLKQVFVLRAPRRLLQVFVKVHFARHCLQYLYIADYPTASVLGAGAPGTLFSVEWD